MNSPLLASCFPTFRRSIISLSSSVKQLKKNSRCRVQLKCDGTRWRTGGEVKGNWRMEWVTSKHHMTAEHRLARAVQTLQADVHSSPASSRLNWRPRRLKWTRPFCRKTKSGLCACAITFQTQSTPWGLKMQALRSFARLIRTNTVIRHSTEHTSPHQHHHCENLKSRVMLLLTFQRFAKSTLMLSVVENLKINSFDAYNGIGCRPSFVQIRCVKIY